MPFIGNKKGNPVTTVENSTQGTNVQPTVQYVENAAKLIIGNLSADPANGNNRGRKPAFKKVIHTIDDRGDEDNDEILTISTIEVNTIEDMQHSMPHNTCDEVFAILKINQPEKKWKINLTGAQSNVLPIMQATSHNRPREV